MSDRLFKLLGISLRRFLLAGFLVLAAAFATIALAPTIGMAAFLALDLQHWNMPEGRR